MSKTEHASAKKCQRKRNGIPGANTVQKSPRDANNTPVKTRADASGPNKFERTCTRVKLTRRPHVEHGRVQRIARKLGISLVPRGFTAKA